MRAENSIGMRMGFASKVTTMPAPMLNRLHGTSGKGTSRDSLNITETLCHWAA